MGMGGGYGMGGMGRHHGYRGGHHGYRGSAMRLPWMGVLAATAVAGGAAAVYPRGARSHVTWKEGSKQVSAQVHHARVFFCFFCWPSRFCAKFALRQRERERGGEEVQDSGRLVFGWLSVDDLCVWVRTVVIFRLCLPFRERWRCRQAVDILADKQTTRLGCIKVCTERAEAVCT